MVRSLLLVAMLTPAACGSHHDDARDEPPPAGGPGAGLATNQRALDLPPRLQWESNYGYCGEVSLISAGMMYGQYLSQYDARAIASPGVSQSQASSQLLLGVNDTAAAAAMHLKNEAYAESGSPDPKRFLAWVKSHVLAGHPVAVGIFMNMSRFHGATDGGNQGDSDYDHIVPVYGLGSNADWGDLAYHGDDTLSLSDNGLWQGSANPPYKFTFTFDGMPKTRSQANSAKGDVYALPTGTSNYGLAITGIEDDDGETLPLHLSSNPNSEPEIADGSGTRPSATTLTLTLTAYDLKPGVAYKLYHYDDFSKVPNGRFNAQASLAKDVTPVTVASGTTYTTTRQISSSAAAIYRLVPATAP